LPHDPRHLDLILPLFSYTNETIVTTHIEHPAIPRSLP
jgi:hypothetical protein